MDTKKTALLQLVNLPGWAVLIEYFEQGCKDLEADVMNADPADEKKVLAAHRIAVGGWRLLLEVQARIKNDLSELEPKETKTLSRDEEDALYLKSLQ